VLRSVSPGSALKSRYGNDRGFGRIPSRLNVFSSEQYGVELCGRLLAVPADALLGIRLAPRYAAMSGSNRGRSTAAVRGRVVCMHISSSNSQLQPFIPSVSVSEILFPILKYYL